ncbi:MAG: ABC transporter permease [Dactylosporangium sp.]|nr:ABC transporter permease [Dactylosporangium sp.]NNJ62930.1 ABC transporter permease [Dactylosporangium sp.]
MPPSAESVIHDLGYQRYTGPRLGRGYAVRSLYLHSLRSAFGLGRGAKAKIFPWSVAALIGLIAVIVTVVTSVVDETVMTYPEFSDQVGFLTVLFTAAVAAEVTTRDLSANVLPLYFARPLTRTDYALAKLAAVVTAIVLLLGVPQLLMFAGTAFSGDLSLGQALDEVVDLSGGLAFSLLHALLIGSIGVLAASLCRRKAFAAALVVAPFVVTAPVTTVLMSAPSQTVVDIGRLTNPLTVLMGVRNWLFDDHSDIGSIGAVCGAVAVGLVVVTGLATVIRYWKVKA